MPHKAFDRREELMAEIVFEQLSRTNKLILLGHNGHLSKSSSDYSLVEENESATSSAPLWRLLGERLKEKDVSSLCIFQLANEGSHSAPFREKIPFKVSPENGTYEAAIASKHSAPVLLLTSEVVNLFGRMDLRENFASRIRGKIENMADWVVFYPKCTGI